MDFKIRGLNMYCHWRRLCITAVVLTLLSTPEGIDGSQETTTGTMRATEEESFTPPADWYSTAGPGDEDLDNNASNETKSEEDTKQEGEAGAYPKVEALWRSNNHFEDNYWHHYDTWRRHSTYDDFYRGKTWKESKWTDFKNRQRYQDYHRRWQPYNSLPQQENRWDNPQDDEWNFGSGASKCNKIRQEEIPDQPHGYADQAYQPPRGMEKDRVAVNVSAYDIYKERCCLGKTYPMYPNGKYACCGSSDYNTVRQACCGSTVHALQVGYECCGEKYINVETEICCFHPEKGITSRQFPAINNETRDTHLFTQCCGDELFDSRSHICFFVTSRQNKLANFTVIQRKYKHTGCCEGKPYDQDNGTCNETGKVYTFLTGPPCIFKQAYEQAQKSSRSREKPEYHSYYWSGHHPHYRRPDSDWGHESFTSQCGNLTYNYRYQMCCGDRYNEEINGTVTILKKTPNSGCCGLESYNYYSQRCCNGRIHENVGGHYQQCCGQRLYDPISQWCCEGSNTVMEAQTGNGERCCGSEGLVFNSSSHICCKNRLAKIPQDNHGYHHWRRSDWRCCSSNENDLSGAVYDSEKALCCNGVLHNIDRWNRWDYQCCGNQVYERRHSVCCAGKAYNDSSCCNNKEAYNPRTHTCCGGKVAEKTSSHAEQCCGRATYDSQIQTCCQVSNTSEWQLTYKRSRYEKCCNGNPYDSDNEACCGSSLIIDRRKRICCGMYDDETGNYTYVAAEKKTNASSSSCCGLSAYDRNSEICCDFNALPDPHKNATCCGTNTYEPRSQICCSGSVHNRSDDDDIKCCGKYVYDLRKQICCHGVPLSVEDVNTAMCCYENVRSF